MVLAVAVTLSQVEKHISHHIMVVKDNLGM